jgi:pyruvate ferredoxin oxidoreductase gamma subunit
MIGIRWHARAGQGAKSAAQVLALAELRAGKSVQAFPEYGPERRGAPLRAYTRIDDKPIRRHDSIDEPDVVVVLEPSLVHDVDVTEGMDAKGFVVIDADEQPAALDGARVVWVPATRIAESHGLKFANVVVLGALAGALGEPPLPELADAAVELLGKRSDPNAVRAAIAEGHDWVSAEELQWAS